MVRLNNSRLNITMTNFSKNEAIMKLCVTFITKLFNWFKRRRLLKDGEISKLKQQESTKCSQCGNVVEVLLSCTGLDDSVVYKCAHCQCTITDPGTSVITESAKVIPSWSSREKIINFKDGEIKFVDKIHSCRLGIQYSLSARLISCL